MSAEVETTPDGQELVPSSTTPQAQTATGFNATAKGPRPLEQEYIDLLKEKITWLERQIADSQVQKDDQKAKKVEDKDDDGESGSVQDGYSFDKPAPPVVEEKSGPKARVRYIKRLKNQRGPPKDEFVTKEDFKGTAQDDANKDGESDEYAISWRQSWKKDRPGNRKLLIESKVLKDALKEVVKGHSMVSFDTNEVKLKKPFEIIFHNETALRDYYLKKPDTKEDIEILLHEVENEPSQRIQRLDARKLTASGIITFDLLWTLYHPGQLVNAPILIGQEKYDQFCILSIVHYPRNSSSTLYLQLEWIDFNGKQFVYSSHVVSIDPFRGSRAIVELEVVPLNFYKNNNGEMVMDSLNLLLHKRGERFQTLVTAAITQKHFHYKGTMVPEGRLEMVVDAPGEDMSDKESTWTFATKGGEGSQDEVAKEITSVMVDHEAYMDYGNKAPKLGTENADYIPCNCGPCTSLRKELLGEFPVLEDGQKPFLKDTQFKFCPPRVFGFNMKQKQWVQMLVDNVDEISQDGRRDAWDKLEMKDGSKRMLERLVRQHDEMVSYVTDLVPGKGNGLIALLHGPPGVGKTLTAESLAMLTARPLYSLSMSDIGSRSATVEQNLLRIFELATHWRALLLFDEADVFLEKRSIGDLQRNGLVSVFIRLLEYYHGILFLTTNRIRTFDEAFQSRIHVALQYSDLETSQCKRIWENWLDKAKDSGDLASKEYIMERIEGDGDYLKLNGRQIRNTFRCAVALAKAEGKNQPLTWEHLDTALRSTVKFKTHMNQTNRQAEMEGLRFRE